MSDYFPFVRGIVALVICSFVEGWEDTQKKLRAMWQDLSLSGAIIPFILGALGL